MREAIRRPIRSAAEAIASASSLAVTCHVNPDGDALGSAIGFALAARAAGLRAVVSFGGKFVVPASFEFLNLSPLVDPAEFPDDADVVVVFDVASRERLGDLAAVVRGARCVVVVDHHVTNEGFGDVAVIDPKAGASAQLAYYLIDELGWPIGRDAAEALLAGIVTDTGRFQYSSTDAEVMRVATALLERGARPEVIGQAVYESVPFGYLAVSAAVLGRAVLDERHGLVWSVLFDADLRAAGVDAADVDGLIDDLRIAREADVAALLKQVPEGFKVSLRGRGEVDVGAIASENGGGGHHNAAGFTTPDGVEAIISRLEERLG
jgi:phosphoesterase RecJ-like protein